MTLSTSTTWLPSTKTKKMMADDIAFPKKNPSDKCNGRKKDGTGYCQNPAGWKTDHVGTGRCHLHGGLATGRPIIHGKTSIHAMRQEIKDGTLNDLMEKFIAIDSTDSRQEIAMYRAYVVKVINQQEELIDAILAWHESNGTKPKPDDLPKISVVARSLKELTDAIQKQRKLVLDTAVSARRFRNFLTNLKSIVEHNCTEEQQEIIFPAIQAAVAKVRE